MKLLLVIFFTLSLVADGQGAPASLYAGQESRGIKALSSIDSADLLAGKGMGLAKAAELNGYPGPAHVLELASELALTPEQRARTEALFSSMQAQAQAIGRQVIDDERTLDTLFASKHASQEQLTAILAGIGAKQAALRGTHLAAHIEQARILMPEQIARYATLRGYDVGTAGAPAREHKH